ncbi:MAG TPA: imidazolonepropionase [Phycisphaerales bacterium]|jgi:imidazolonepropionase-like amidohydrolase|nr:imidazolonepropionase [Phycisphaerales bacterium]|tara:strand:+ start:63 stop:1352 length:1290 start_codon:yes stop_codon:yes gene_type:complete
MIRIMSLLTLALLSATALGQSRQIPASDTEGPVLLINATIHPVTAEPLESGWMAFENGRITLIGRGDRPSIDGAEIIDLEGRHVYPGLVAADSILGLVETGMAEVTHDHDEQGSFTPEARAVVALNPDSDLIPVTRASGILTALVVPDGGRLPGQAAVIHLDGWDWEDLAVTPSAAIVIEWPSMDRPSFGTRASDDGKAATKQLDTLNDYLDEAEAYLAACDADNTLTPDSRAESLRPALAGEQPVLIKASTAGQIATAVAWAKMRGLDPIILGGEEADEVASLLVEEDVPVIVRGVHRYPRSRSRNPDEPHALPARLRDKGVRFCIAPRDRPAHLRNLPHHAATAVANGLTPKEGLRAITIDAAEIIGVGETLGSLEPGKSATFIVTTGDPLQIRTEVEQAWIDGRPIDLSTRHTQLRDKYRRKYAEG